MFNKKIMLILIFTISLICISAVSAADDAQNSTDAPDNTLGDEVKSVTLSAKKMSTTYDSGKSFNVKAVDTKTKKPAGNLKIALKVYTGKKHKTITKTTDSNGIAKYALSKLSVGKHKIVINLKDTKISSKSKTSSVKISKAKVKISAPKITNKYKQNKKFKITVKNKESKKPMKGVKLIVKVFTGKKYKKYTLKTDKKGVAGINVKSLKKGSHRVTVSVKATSKIKKASAKSIIKTVDNSKYFKIKVNGYTLKVKLANTKAAKALYSKLKKGDVTVEAEDYGNFEKVGDLGFSLPANDKYISTKAGDVVLYDSDQICLYYSTNTYDFTRLGKVTNISPDKLKSILGKGDVTYVLTLK